MLYFCIFFIALVPVKTSGNLQLNFYLLCMADVTPLMKFFNESFWFQKRRLGLLNSQQEVVKDSSRFQFTLITYTNVKQMKVRIFSGHERRISEGEVYTQKNLQLFCSRAAAGRQQLSGQCSMFLGLWAIAWRREWHLTLTQHSAFHRCKINW